MALKDAEISLICSRYGLKGKLHPGFYEVRCPDRELRARFAVLGDGELGFVRCTYFFPTSDGPLVWFSSDSLYEFELAVVFQALRPGDHR